MLLVFGEKSNEPKNLTSVLFFFNVAKKSDFPTSDNTRLTMYAIEL